MDLIRGLQTFVAVVESGSFTAAANQFNTSSAAVSRQVSALEEHLGALLLQRTTRTLSLTEPGHALYERAQSILSEISAVETQIGSHALQPKGLLRINTAQSFGVRVLGPLLPEFRRRYPGIHLDVRLSDQMVDLVEEAVDVAVCIARQPSQQLIARRLATVELVICASPDYLARRGVPRRPEDLTEHDTLSYSFLSLDDHWTLVDDAGQETQVKVLTPVYSTSSDILLQMALSGGGITIQPRIAVAKELESGAMVQVLEGWKAHNPDIFAVYVSRKFLSAKVRVFIDYLAEAMKRLEWV